MKLDHVTQLSAKENVKQGKKADQNLGRHTKAMCLVCVTYGPNKRATGDEHNWEGSPGPGTQGIKLPK